MALILGDCLEVMPGLEAGSVDAVVTDPPYGLTGDDANWWKKSGTDMNGRPEATARRGGFMGKAWDGTGVAFRLETWAAMLRLARPGAYLLAFGGTRTYHRMTCAIEDAGWIIRDCLVWAYASGFPKSRALLKPAWEPIVMARKPGPLRELAIDACRIPGEAATWETPRGGIWSTDPTAKAELLTREGRWPANVLLTDPIFDGDTPGVVGGGLSLPGSGIAYGSHGFDGGLFGNGRDVTLPDDGYGDSGTYSRFFLVPKSARSEREPIITPDGHDPRRRFTTHPTIKPLDLMRHLVRLVTPTGGTVLDPFGGSGTTALACELEGFPWVLIEREAEYVAIAEARLNGTQKGLGLPA